MESKIRTVYKVYHGSGTLNINDKYQHDSAELAIQSAREFKTDPGAENPRMSNESVEYWKAQELTIKKETLIEETILKL